MALPIETDTSRIALTSPDNLHHYGSLDQGRILNLEHQRIADIHPTSFPYWEPEILDPQNSFHFAFQRNGLVIRWGTLETFPTHDIATIIDSNIKRYVEAKLFGDFPWNISAKREKLTAAFLGNFTNHRLIISVRNENESQIIGGCMIAPGESSRPLQEMNGNADSCLPTYQALNINTNGSKGWSEASENTTACFIRFFRVKDELFPASTPENRNTKLRQFSSETLSGMALALQEWTKNAKRTITHTTLDTHDINIIRILTKFYGGEVIDSHPTPTDHVLTSPLGDHYRLNGIQVVGFDFDQQLKLAHQIDIDLGKKTII
jgi:hypothetical protein